MTSAEPTRRQTRQTAVSDVQPFDRRDLEPNTRDALAGLLLAMADDEFVLGHAKVWYEMLAVLAGEKADRLAFGREAKQYHHARLLDHPRTDWAFSIARRYLYDTADSVRLSALTRSSFKPLADVVAKVRREERYHLLHMDTWLRRLADHRGEPRDRLVAALDSLAEDALSVFAPLSGERLLVEAGVIDAPMVELCERWRPQVDDVFSSLGLPLLPAGAPPPNGRSREPLSDSFGWLWSEFTSVHRLEEGAVW